MLVALLRGDSGESELHCETCKLMPRALDELNGFKQKWVEPHMSKKPVNKHKLLIISGPVDLSSNICLSHSGINIKIVEFRPFPVVCSSVFGVVFG